MFKHGTNNKRSKNVFTIYALNRSIICKRGRKFTVLTLAVSRKSHKTDHMFIWNSNSEWYSDGYFR